MYLRRCCFEVTLTPLLFAKNINYAPHSRLCPGRVQWGPANWLDGSRHSGDKNSVTGSFRKLGNHPLDVKGSVTSRRQSTRAQSTEPVVGAEYLVVARLRSNMGRAKGVHSKRRLDTETGKDVSIEPTHPHRVLG